MTKSAGIIRDIKYLEHKSDQGHPENPRRLEAIYTMLEEPDMRDLFIDIAPRVAEKNEIYLIHTVDYEKQIAATQGQELTMLSPDTYATSKSYSTALLAVGGLLEAITTVVLGKIKNAFALIRPPGHHAERSRAMGYCLFNNVAIGASFARKVLGLPKVLIIDWDLHHGNGTQHAFETDPSVLFFSTHQANIYPGTGYYTEVGRGKGEGYTVNLPLPKGFGNAEYIVIFEKLIRPIAIEFQPSIIIVSAGFDIHHSDPLGKMKVTPEGFGALTRSVMEMAEECCDGKLVLCLEGGYHLTALKESVKFVIQELSGKRITPIDPLIEQANRKKTEYVLTRCLHVHRQFWKSLNNKIN